jgi:hypothetical protein
VTLKEADQHDREIAAIRKLILTGMKMINRNQQQINELRELQKVTHEELRAFISSMRRGSNGHNQGPIR